MTSPPNPTSEELLQQVSELQRRVEQLERERDQYRNTLYDLADDLFAADPNWQPPPMAEAISARELIAELESPAAVSNPNFTVRLSPKVGDEIRRLIAPGADDRDELLRDFKSAVGKMEAAPFAFGEARENLPYIGMRTRLAFEGLLAIRFAVHEENKEVWIQIVRDRRRKRGSP